MIYVSLCLLRAILDCGPLQLSIRFLETRLSNQPNKEDKSSTVSSLSSNEQKAVEDEDEVGLAWEKWEIGFKIHSTAHCYPSSSQRNLSQHLLFNPISYLSAKSDKSSGPSFILSQISH